MIGISKLYCGTVEPSDVLRYGAKAKQLPSHLLQFSSDKKPVVVWNCTRRCNLRCRHCYSRSADRHYEAELTTAEGFALLEDLAQFGAFTLQAGGQFIELLLAQRHGFPLDLQLGDELIGFGIFEIPGRPGETEGVSQPVRQRHGGRFPEENRAEEINHDAHGGADPGVFK